MLILLVLLSVFLTLPRRIVSVKSRGEWNLLFRSMHKAYPLVKTNLKDIIQFYFTSSTPIKSLWNPHWVTFALIKAEWGRWRYLGVRRPLPQQSTNSQHPVCSHFVTFKSLSNRALCMCSCLLEEDGQGITLQNWPGQSIKVSRARVAQEYPQKPGLMGAKLFPCQSALLSICLS